MRMSIDRMAEYISTNAFGGHKMSLTEAQKRANAKHIANHYKRIPLDVKIEDAEKITTHAKNRGESVRKFILRAIRETMERDGEL